MPIARRIAALMLPLMLPACGRSREAAGPPVTQPPTGALQTTTLAGGFDTIWDLAWGPDNAIWLTERRGRIARVDPATGNVTQIGSIEVNEAGEGGLMGMAFHPDFASGQPWIYLAHTYSAVTSIRNRIVRVRVNGSTLGAMEVLLDNIPGSSVHNGARLAVGPDRLLYITMGDASNTALPQDSSSLAGKVLRLTLAGAPAPGNFLGTAVYSLGHRNPQGLVFLPDGSLISSEHGPGDNDEVNRIEAGRNYGWPTVRGACDGDAGSGEAAFCTAHRVVEPLARWTPTIAPAGIDWYDAALIPAWRGSLLMTTLKGSALYRLSMSADRRSITGQEILVPGTFGRLRDVLVAPDGSVYIATSNRDGRGSPATNDDRIIRIRPQ